MDTIRIVRALKRELLEHYPDQDGYFLAERLCEAGMTELTDEIIEKLNFLHGKCKDFSLDNSAWLVSYTSMAVLMERYNRFLKYCGDMECKMSAFELTEEKFEQYIQLFTSLKMSNEQINKCMGIAIINGTILKNIDEVRAAVSALDVFNLPAEEKNTFIVDNGVLLFNDYSRKIQDSISALIELHGVVGGYKKLKEHPEILRLGLE